MLKKITTQLIVLSFFVTSCLNYTQITTVKTDNSGQMFIHYWMHWTSESDSILYQNQKLFNTDSIKTNFKCPTNKIEKIEVYNNNADSTIHGKISFTFTNFDSLNIAKAFKDMNFSISDGDGNTKIFTQSLPTYFSNTFSTNTDIQFQYIYYIPGKILSHNATSLSRNKLTWNLNKKNLIGIKELKAVFIPFRLKETPKVIYYLTFIIIVIVLYYLLRKKKK